LSQAASREAARQYAYGAQSSTHPVGIIEQLARSGDGNGSGDGDGSSAVLRRTPQSAQSVPYWQAVYSAPGPPSSQRPSDAKPGCAPAGRPMHVSAHRLPGAKGGGGGAGGKRGGEGDAGGDSGQAATGDVRHTLPGPMLPTAPVSHASTQVPFTKYLTWNALTVFPCTPSYWVAQRFVTAAGAERLKLTHPPIL